MGHVALIAGVAAVSLDRAHSVVTVMRAKGIARDAYTYSTLVGAHARAGDFTGAMNVCISLPVCYLSLSLYLSV